MLMSRIISDVNLISASLPELIRIIQHTLTMIGLIALTVYRDPKLAFWACLVFPLAIYPVIFLARNCERSDANINQKSPTSHRTYRKVSTVCEW